MSDETRTQLGHGSLAGRAVFVWTCPEPECGYRRSSLSIAQLIYRTRVSHYHQEHGGYPPLMKPEELSYIEVPDTEGVVA